MLLENYDSEYLKSIANRIEDYSLRYRELYTDSYNKLEHSLNKSVQGQVLMRRLIKAQNDQVKPFVDNIRMVNAINNEPVELMFDSDNIYIKESYAE